jgi:hypothetical protein
MSSRDTNSTVLGFSEVGIAEHRYNAQSTPIYSTTGSGTSIQVAAVVEAVGINNNVSVRMVRATGNGSNGVRNHFTVEHIFCTPNIGTTRAWVMGHIDNTYIGGPAVASVSFTCSAGNMSGTYSTVHSY